MSRRRNCCCNSCYGGFPGNGFGGFGGFPGNGFGGFGGLGSFNNCGCYRGCCGFPYNSLLGNSCFFNNPMLIFLLLLGRNRFFRF